MGRPVSQAAHLLLIASLSLHADWLTGHDPQRSGWASEETQVNVQNAEDPN
jgi:hypothetical protein